MTNAREIDIGWLKSLTENQLKDLFFVHIRDMWAVDGLYFLGIESRFGTESAIEIDRQVWESMGAIECKRLIKIFNVQEDRPFDKFVDLIKAASWFLDLENKDLKYDSGVNKITITNFRCRVQNTRLKKGLSEFPCKPVRFGFMESFAKTYNPNIKVNCIICPPDEHPEDLWCQWEFINE
jgi:hypothetical protein